MGNTIQLDTEQIIIDDPLLVIGTNSTTANDNNYVGFLGRHGGGTGVGNAKYRFSGLVRSLNTDREYSLLKDIPHNGSDIEVPSISHQILQHYLNYLI